MTSFFFFFFFFFFFLQFRLRTRDIRDCVSQEEQGQDDQELIFTQTAKDLSDLIVYCRSLSIKPWDWKKQKATSVSEMFSFGEPTALDLCKRYPRGVISKRTALSNDSISYTIQLLFLA